MSLVEIYRRLGSAVRVDDRRATAIVAEAQPHASAASGQPTGSELPVSVRCVEPAVARGGSVIPAWPVREPDGSVVIDYVPDWGVLLAGWIAAVDPADQELAMKLVQSGQRTWIGIANDVLQLFLPDPPRGTYSMVRHHALMLGAATAWLGPDAVRRWRVVHASAGARFARRHTDLWAAIDAAERGLDTLLQDQRAHQAAPQTLAWLDAHDSARTAYVLEYLSAASLGVAAVLDALTTSGMGMNTWLAQAVAVLHADPNFNRAWIEQLAHRLSVVCAR